MMCDRVCVWHAVLVNPYCYMYETASKLSSMGKPNSHWVAATSCVRELANRIDSANSDHGISMY